MGIIFVMEIKKKQNNWERIILAIIELICYSLLYIIDFLKLANLKKFHSST